MVNVVISGNRTKVNESNYKLARVLAKIGCQQNPSYTANRALGGPAV